MTYAKPLLALVLAVLSAPLASRSAQAQSLWHVDKTLQIGGEGGMDYLTADPSTHLLYVPRTTHTLVIDAVSGKTVGDIPGQTKAHGVALVPKLGRGFITDGGKGSITIFDLKTNNVLGVIAAVPDADGIIYDEGTDLILVSAGDSGSLVTLKPDVDPKSGMIDTPIPLGGAPEFLAADGEGKVYVNLEDKDSVAVVDLRARKVIDHWPVAPGGSPVGLSLDKKHHRLFIGCRKPQKMIVMSATDGKVLADLPIGAGVDATKVNGSEAFASCGDGTLAVISEFADGKFQVAQTVNTARGAKTLGLDSASGKIYLPTFDFEDAKPATAARPKAKPGTFKILVLSR